jgi:hypothetical protein
MFDNECYRALESVAGAEIRLVFDSLVMPDVLLAEKRPFTSLEL